MKKFFSLILALVMALSLTTMAWGADALPAGTTVNGVTTIELTEAVTLASRVTITEDTVIDLKGFTVSGSDTFVFVVKEGKSLTVNGPGEIVAAMVGIQSTGNGSTANKIILNNVTLNSEYFGVYHNGNAFGADVTINNSTITDTSDDGAGVFLSGSAAWAADQFNKLTITNNSTIKGATAVEVKNGNVVVDNSTLTATYNGTAGITAQNSGSSSLGYALALTHSGADGTSEDAKGSITVNSGNINGAVGIQETGGAIKDNPAATTPNTTTAAITISGGTFSVMPDASYLADGMQLLANGTVVTTPAAGTPVPTLYVWNNATAKWDTYCIAFGMDMDDLKQDASDNCLPCYYVNGKYFIETTSAAATYKLTYGAAKVVYLAPVAEEDVHYDYKASVLKVVDDEDATCGDWYVADLDEDDVYYISYDKKGVVVEGVYVAAKNGPVQILVKGKIVDVKSLTQDDIKQLPHDWKGYDVVDHEYTTVKCANCGKVATLYANGTAAGKDAVKVTDNGTVLGYITAAADSFGAASAGTSTDKVQSAETFDAGIALYVGMSVMAAAGSAVVLKKKD